MQGSNIPTNSDPDAIMREAKERTPEELSDATKAELSKYGLEAISKIQMRDPVSGETRMIAIDRAGYNEQRLMMTLADPEKTRDQKDFAVSMYLYERGKESTSMVVDLMRYKGQHTKETRAFTSQIRFDFEMFVATFTKYLENQSRLLAITLDLDIREEREKFRSWLSLENNKGQGYTYLDFWRSDGEPVSSEAKSRMALIEMAIMSLDEAERLSDVVHRIARARQQEKGYGIYIDKRGKPYTVNDPEIEEIVKADRESTKNSQKDD